MVMVATSQPIYGAQETQATASSVASDDNTVTLNFANADLPAVIKAAAEITGKDVLIDPRVSGTVTIVTPKPVPRNLVWGIMLSALRAQGFTAVGSDIAVRADQPFFFTREKDEPDRALGTDA